MLDSSEAVELWGLCREFEKFCVDSEWFSTAGAGALNVQVAVWVGNPCW